MKKSLTHWLVLALLLPASASAQQFSITYAGSHPADPQVLELVKKYTPHLITWTTVADRDEKRKPMVAPGYFYHGTDGDFIGFDGLTKRQTENDLRIIARRLFDVVLHQYENTAVLTYKAWTRGTDKGKVFEGYGSAAVVMTRTANGWRTVADIVGEEPSAPASGQPGSARD